MNTREMGQWIAFLRREKQYTQAELGALLHVTDKAVSRWETGRGMPDTASLPALAQALDVSVGELLAGKRFENGDKALLEQSENAVRAALSYSGRTLRGTVNGAVLAMGVMLLLSPLFTATRGISALPVVGAVLILGGTVGIFLRRRGQRLSAAVLRGLAAAALLAALVLESLPCSAVLFFSTGPDTQVRRTFSHFSLIPFGYANFSPLLTGLATAAATLLVGIGLLWRGGARVRRAAFLCTVAAFGLSMLPEIVFGMAYITQSGIAITLVLLLSGGLQALGNRGE